MRKGFISAVFDFQRPFKHFGNWNHHYRLEVCWKDTLETFGFTLHSYRKKSFGGKKRKRKKELYCPAESHFTYFSPDQASCWKSIAIDTWTSKSSPAENAFWHFLSKSCFLSFVTWQYHNRKIPCSEQLDTQRSVKGFLI